MKLNILLQNRNNIDRKIWVTLPSTSEKLKEAIADINLVPDDGYIICNIISDTDFNINISQNSDIFKINSEVQRLNEV